MGGIRRGTAGEQCPFGLEPGQLARTLQTGAEVGPHVRRPIGGQFIERERLEILDREVRHRAPSRYPARLLRSCSRARWISFLTFCSDQPIAEAISEYPRP